MNKIAFPSIRVEPKKERKERNREFVENYDHCSWQFNLIITALCADWLALDVSTCVISTFPQWVRALCCSQMVQETPLNMEIVSPFTSLLFRVSFHIYWNSISLSSQCSIIFSWWLRLWSNLCNDFFHCFHLCLWRLKVKFQMRSKIENFSHFSTQLIIMSISDYFLHNVFWNV